MWHIDYTKWQGIYRFNLYHNKVDLFLSSMSILSGEGPVQGRKEWWQGGLGGRWVTKEMETRPENKNLYLKKSQRSKQRVCEGNVVWIIAYKYGPCGPAMTAAGRVSAFRLRVMASTRFVCCVTTAAADDKCLSWVSLKRCHLLSIYIEAGRMSPPTHPFWSLSPIIKASSSSSSSPPGTDTASSLQSDPHYILLHPSRSGVMILDTI